HCRPASPTALAACAPCRKLLPNPSFLIQARAISWRSPIRFQRRMRATLECMRIRSTASVSPITRNEGWRAVPDGNRSECRDLTPPAVIEQTAQKKQEPPLRTAQLVHHCSVSCPSVLCGYFSTLSPSLPFRTGRAH